MSVSPQKNFRDLSNKPETPELMSTSSRKIRKTSPFQETTTIERDRRKESDARQPISRSILRRRNTLFATFQAVLDGALIASLAIGMSYLKFDSLPREYLGLTITLLVTMGIVYDRMGIYRHHRDIHKKAILLLKAWSIAFGVLLSFGFLLKITEFYSRQYLLVLFVSGYGLQFLAHLLGVRLAYRIQTRKDDKLGLIVGSGQLARYMFDKINQNPWIPEKIIGVIKAEQEYGEFLTSNIVDESERRDRPPVLGGIGDVLKLVEEHDIRTVYFAVALDSSPLIEKLYLNLLDKNVDVHWAPNIFGMNLVNYSVKEMSGIPIITLSESPMAGINLVIKGVEDKLLALFGLIVVSPIMLLAAIAVKLDSKGPVLFAQERTGWDGKTFRIWKFRTMKVHDPEKGFVRQATKDDPRITRVGRFLRRTSIDELPQLFNVLNGTMSLVGPRPHAVSHNVTYSERIEAYLARHRIKPGITGLAQVRGYRGETKDLTEMIKRVECDLEYINNWSLWMDIQIMLRTVVTLLHEKAY